LNGSAPARLVNYLGALFIERSRSRLALAAIITFNLGLLGYYTPAGIQNEWVRVEQHS
jgi:hypothetical protein